MNFLKQKKILYPLLLLLLILLIYRLVSPADEGLYYTVQRSDFLLDIKVDGEVKALNSYVIKAPANIWGNVRIVRLVPEGNMVKKGDFLIQFDASDFRQKLLEAKNKLETAKADLSSTKANIISQMAELESNLQLEKYSLEQSRLRARNAIYESENKRKEIELNMKKAEISYKQLQSKKQATEKINKASLRQAELKVEQALLKMKRAEEDLKKLTVTSPADGLVVYKEVWEGNKMAKLKVGYSPWRGQPLLEIPSRNKMKVKVKVDEVDISQVALDQKVEVRLDAISDTLFLGKVKEIASLAYKDRDTKKNVFDVEIYLDSSDARLKPGMSAHCRIIVKKLKNVLSVPIDAITIKDGKSLVYLKNGKAKEISAGPSNSDFIVVENGLSEGDVIRLPTESTLKQPKPVKRKPKKKKSKEQNIRIIVG